MEATPGMKRKTLMSWSSGKDSAWALHQLHQNPEIEVVGLFCTVNRVFGRVAMHGVRVELLRRQAEAIGLPLEIIEIPYPCSDAEYAEIMGQFVARARHDQIAHFAFGDLYLESVRRYREKKLAGTGISPLFPLWGKPTAALAQEMMDAGLKTVITCLDPALIPEALAGKPFNAEFLAALPQTADACGENGEFHSFVFDGPMFKYKLDIVVGETVRRDGFVFADVLAQY
jgi:uncharacterized protein (TIGR00290 family)